MFSIGDLDITTGDVAISSLTLTLIIAVSVAIFMYISWRNRQKIQAAAIRASVAIRRSTRQIRASIKQIMNKAEKGPSDLPEEPVDAKLEAEKMGLKRG